MAIEDESSGGDNAIESGQFVVCKILLHVKHLKLKIEVQRWTFVK